TEQSELSAKINQSRFGGRVWGGVTAFPPADGSTADRQSRRPAILAYRARLSQRSKYERPKRARTIAERGGSRGALARQGGQLANAAGTQQPSSSAAHP